MAKLIIKLINSVGEIVNNDPDVNGRLKIVFLPDFFDEESLILRNIEHCDLYQKLS